MWRKAGGRLRAAEYFLAHLVVAFHGQISLAPALVDETQPGMGVGALCVESQRSAEICFGFIKVAVHKIDGKRSRKESRWKTFEKGIWLVSKGMSKPEKDALSKMQQVVIPSHVPGPPERRQRRLAVSVGRGVQRLH